MKKIKPVAVELPCPDLTGIKKDKGVGFALGKPYSGKNGEISAVLQYVYHAEYFESAGDADTASLLRGIALSEMEHVSILARTIKELGVDPVYGVYTPFGIDFYQSSQVSQANNEGKMLLDDILSETLAIREYKDLISTVCDEQVVAVLKRILLDEELHLSALKERLKNRNTIAREF